MELIVSGADPSGESFYFLEMNTRLQVEHPVTEAITGIDLVEQMIRVAYGEKLAMTQDDIKIDGWAIENRVYAEDPYRGFLPSTGRLERLRFPDEMEHLRVDTGVREGDEVSIYYDPMLAKLVAWGGDRLEAMDRLRKALESTVVDGVRTPGNLGAILRTAAAAGVDQVVLVAGGDQITESIAVDQ